MKRKLLVILTAVVMMMSASLTVLAQPSAEGTSAISIVSVIDKSNKVLDDSSNCHVLVVDNLKGEELEQAKDIVKPENLKTVLTEAEAKKNWTSFNFDAYLYDVLEKEEVDWTDGDYHFPLTITFKVPGVTANSNVKVLHYYPTSWHTEKVVNVNKDEVTVTFSHLSPIVIMVDNPASTGTGTVTSPQTGESNIVLYGILMACIALAGAVITKKKANV